MKTPRKLKNIEALLYYRAVISTAGTVSDISQALERNGFTPDILEEGQALRIGPSKQVIDFNRDIQVFTDAGIIVPDSEALGR